MPSTIIYQAGDLLLVDFPFTTGGQSKPRPALVILDTGDADVLLARVTTQIWSTRFDVRIAAWQSAGLLAPSVVRLHKLATLSKHRVTRKIGEVASSDRQQVSAALSQIVVSW